MITVTDTLSPAVQAMLDAAAPLVGLHASQPEYVSAIAPGETPDRAVQMAEMSSCALVWRGLVGAVFAVELPPYVTGSAFEVLWGLALGSPWRPGNACRVPTADRPPELGDAIVYDRGPGGPEHVDAVVTSSRLDGAYLRVSAVAGGQHLEGAEAILEVPRALRWTGGRWVDTALGRPVMACISPDGLSALHGLRAAG